MSVTVIDVCDLDDTELGATIRAMLAEDTVILVTDGANHAQVRHEDDPPLPKDPS